MVLSSKQGYDANGAFDATGGSITFTGAGTLSAGSVTGLGTLGTSAVRLNMMEQIKYFQIRIIIYC